MRKTAQIVLGLVISGLAFWLAFSNANLAEVAQALREANYYYLVPAVGLIWLGLFMRAQSWRVILGGALPFGRVYSALNVGYLLNNLLPLRLGEFGRAYLITRHSRLPVPQTLSSVVVERAIDLLMIVVLMGAFVPLIVGLESARLVALGTAGAGLAALAALVLLARYREGVLRLVRAVLARLPWLRPEPWEARAEAFLSGLAVLQDPRRAFTAAFWSGLAWVSAGFGVWMLLLAFIPGARLSMGFFVLTISGLGIAVPAAPGAAGVFEFAVVQALAVFGFGASRALSVALVYHLTHIGLTSTLGGLALAREGETLGHLASAAQAMLTGARGERNRAAPAPEGASPAAPENASPSITPEP